MRCAPQNDIDKTFVCALPGAWRVAVPEAPHPQERSSTSRVCPCGRIADGQASKLGPASSEADLGNAIASSRAGGALSLWLRMHNERVAVHGAGRA